VASTRLILSEASSEGVEAAGGVIASFGEFVAAGSPLVGGVVFAIVVVIQFLVITKGATRISEVAARFALDGMPGRQAAVDADLASGLLTPEMAQERRAEIARQADFYGAMDGAGKFVRGDAVAGLAITIINIVGGLGIGVLQDGLPLADAIDLYTTLTIGDGLVSQVPAFLISLAAGFLVTRSSAPTDLSQDVVGQVIAHPFPLWIAAGFLAILAFTGFPTGPMLGLAGMCVVGGLWLTASRIDSHASHAGDGKPSEPKVEVSASKPHAKGASAPGLERHLQVEPLELSLGVSLVRLADKANGGDLLERVSALRERIASELGFILPKVRIQDDLRLDPRQFSIKLRGVPVASGTIYADASLAVNDGFVAGSLKGIDGSEPATGKSGAWIPQAEADEARTLGYRVLLPQVVLLQSLDAAVRRYAGELLTREHVHNLLDHLKQRTPRLVDDLLAGRLSGGEVHRVLAELLAEGLPIRDLETILEALGDAARQSHEHADLTLAARLALRRTIARQFSDSRGVLNAVLVDVPETEQLHQDLELASTFQPSRTRLEQLLPWFGQLTAALDQLVATEHHPVLLCRSECRVVLRDLLRQAGVTAQVIGHRELLPDTDTRIHAEITLFSTQVSTAAA
ncbi:MAG: FHIPEP family type III secretion protein, partial [Planctomycetaceae bacterium]|nr:FHIPEP family type III secretion protein [Planctomycetaceae bacterium]